MGTITSLTAARIQELLDLKANAADLATKADAADLAAKADVEDLVKVFRTTHTFAISGPVTVDVVPGFFVSEAAGQSISLAEIRYKISNAGATVGFKIQRNGADIPGLGTTAIALVAVNTIFTTNPADTELANNDEISLVLISADVGPEDLQVTVVLEHTI